ncbi:P-loop containing nucleoside triphosphate hydrolase protein [Dichotomocladium elegans]|nr:P-loop containing nucleoside triphosphate hydrolase protein [Dichotomocladium elegans]
MLIEEIENEIASIDRQIAILKSRRSQLNQHKQALLDRAMDGDLRSKEASQYESEDHPWSEAIKELAFRHWNIRSFRPLQLPILNAALDLKRDLFVILPTGGGKSLTYQLPPLLEKDKGFTLVISPLISLIQDQVFNLREANICATYMTSTTEQEEVKAIHSSMVQGNDLRLLYVTPEKIGNSKRFMSILNKAPDYKKLNVLRTLFPQTPIMALTATCSRRVMKDVMDILGLKQPYMPNGTLVYSAPLYRPNLIYQVIQKPETHAETIRHMAMWIMTHHPGESGIIYCTTKKEVENVCSDISSYGIAAAAYHADILDAEKEQVHQMWRQNEISVIVATIAFGMGINHLNTRFIIHHSISKSLENFYQETGRAGRDGKDADCVLYYRGLDVYAMVDYAQSLTKCRKILFEEYFGYASFISDATAEDTVVNEITPDAKCGRCDNCRRASDLFKKDITVEALTLVELCKALTERNQRVTMQKLIQLWRGRMLAAHCVADLKGNPAIQLPVNKKYKVQDLERIINHLLMESFLAESFHFTAYNNISYVTAGARSVYTLMLMICLDILLKAGALMNSVI